MCGHARAGGAGSGCRCEFGGQWDHVPPPGQGETTKGVHDAFGPGTRIPTLPISGSFRLGSDYTVYDTTSILATIEHGLASDH